MFCPKCLNNNYILVNDLKGTMFTCNKCSEKLYENELLKFEEISRRKLYIADYNDIEEADRNSNYRNDMIYNNENNDTLDFFLNLIEINNYDFMFQMISSSLDKCNRSEKELLITIIDNILEDGKLDYFYSEKNKIIYIWEVYYDTPLVEYLFKKTNMFFIRQSLRNLIKYNLIIASEQNNYIIVPKMIVDNILINKSLVVNKSNNETISYRFLTYHLPELKDNEVVRQKILIWENKYYTENIINALAITLDKMHHEKVQANITSLLNYTNAILKNNATIKVNNYIKKEYDLKK